MKMADEEVAMGAIRLNRRDPTSPQSPDDGILDVAGRNHNPSCGCPIFCRQW
jgi:hypothetical protein